METTPPTRNPKRQRKKEGAQARRAAELAALHRQRRNRRMVRFGVIAVVAIAAVFAWSWAGGDDEDDADEAATTETTEATESTDTTAVDAEVAAPTCDAPSGENTDMTQKPEVAAPDAPATELACQDLVVGDGAEVTSPSATVTVHYVGVGQQSKQEFDASWGGEPATFTLDGVIAGWTQGMIGMKEGGRRLLTIPGDLAYGPSGRAPSIGPDETLVFVVDLIEIAPAG